MHFNKNLTHKTNNSNSAFLYYVNH